MSESDAKVLKDLLGIPGVKDAITGILGEEIEQVERAMRQKIRAGDTVGAANQEGQLAALESFPALLERGAAKYQVSGGK